MRVTTLLPHHFHNLRNAFAAGSKTDNIKAGRECLRIFAFHETSKLE